MEIMELAALMYAVSPNIVAVDIYVPMNVESESIINDEILYIANI